MDQGYEETSVYLKVNKPAFSAITLIYYFLVKGGLKYILNSKN